MSTVFVKPKAGTLVRLEDGSRHVAPEGEELSRTRYVARRIADGDLIETRRPSTAKADGEGGRKGRS